MGNQMEMPDAEELTQEYEVRGFGVRLTNTRPDIDSRDVLDRLAGALDLIALHAPRRFGRLRQDIQSFVVRRFPCRGAFFPQTGECLVELTFTVNPRHTLAEIAASIVHEATHARIATRFGPLPQSCRAREERLCRQAELEFGLAVPEGATVIERARQALSMADRDVAPLVDWTEGARRVAQADADGDLG
ncbi:MAG: hypothetical protein ACJ8AP_15840 [Gemmatimonadales bacterium]